MLHPMSTPHPHPRPLTIVTGASRGVGHALATALLQRGEHVLTLQRTPDPQLTPGTGLLEQWACDLADPLPVAQRLEAWLAALNPGTLRSVTLINNAALLPPPAPLGQTDSQALAQALRVGLEAPLLLCSAFLRATAGWPAPRRVLNISSGLGRRAMASSSVYCAAKAGLDHLSRVIALEEAEKPNGARCVAIAPGVIDTDMQLQLRSADPKLFSSQAQFAALKAQRQLDTPEGCAAELLAYLARKDFGANPVADVRDAA
jgi:benzil reductase ((S)-benzoin forming)